MQSIKAHCAGFEPERVRCYSFYCDKGLEAGGKDAVNILELAFGGSRKLGPLTRIVQVRAMLAGYSLAVPGDMTTTDKFWLLARFISCGG